MSSTGEYAEVVGWVFWILALAVLLAYTILTGRWQPIAVFLATVAAPFMLWAIIAPILRWWRRRV